MRQDEFLAYIRARDGVTSRELERAFGLTRGTVSRVLKQLRKYGFIEGVQVARLDHVGALPYRYMIKEVCN